MPDITAALAMAQAQGLDRLDAQLLLLHALETEPALAHTRRAWLLAHGDTPVAAAVELQFHSQLRRRLAGEPLAYITGHKAFFGLDLHVDKRVLIPRPDTETLVEWALELLEASSPTRRTTPLTVLDLGTGSGAIALALKHQQPDVEIHAIDASVNALAVASANAQRLGLHVQFSQGSWLDGVRRRYDGIVSNPPYVAAHDPHLAALAYEPSTALVAGADGLHDIRHIVGTATTHLYPSAWLLVEHGYDQGAAVREMLLTGGYESVETRRDFGNQERCSGGRTPAAGPGASATGSTGRT
ncbi:MAG: peptide chain release factor N(5)-glutamine methyltransferase [Rhodoferax sp.]|nr:peptide chain release factor N(5)-glutamine methyltransferase [Rhodoferax sp.]